MELKELLTYIETHHALVAGSEEMRLMSNLSQEAIRITMKINTQYHTSEEMHALLYELMGYEVPKSVRIFPPFNVDFGKNIHLEENVFFNAGCKLQDQGGIYIGKGSLNHEMDPANVIREI